MFIFVYSKGEVKASSEANCSQLSENKPSCCEWQLKVVVIDASLNQHFIQVVDSIVEVNLGWPIEELIVLSGILCLVVTLC